MTAEQRERKVLGVVAEDQLAHAKGSSVSHVHLSYPPEAAELVDQAIAALVAKGFLTRGDVMSQALYLTAAGLCASGSRRAGEAAKFAESLLGWLKARATQERGAFTHFTWEELRKAHVAEADGDFALAITTVQTLRLSGSSTDSFSMGPPPWAKWSVPSDLAQLRTVQDIIGLVERAERLANPAAAKVASRSSGLRPIVSSARESIAQASTEQHEEARNYISRNERGERVDVLIVTAVKDEWDAVLAVHTEAKPGSSWEVISGAAGLEVRYRDFVIEGGSLRIAVVQALGMGREHAVAAAAPLLERHREIRCLAMCGVCAGRRGDVALGDVIVADRAWPYDAGKLKATLDGDGTRTERFQGDMDLYRIDPPEWKQRAERFHVDPASAWIKNRPRSYEEQGDWILERLKKNEDPLAHADRAKKCPDWSAVLKQLWKAKRLEDDELKLTEAGNKHISRRLMLEPDGLRDAAPFKVVVGPIASGAPVVEDPTIFERLSDTHAMRKVIGLEMETSAILMLASVGRVPHAVVMKGVMDHADSFKSDNMKPFAAIASAECLIAFLRENMPRGSAAGRSESSPPIVQALQVPDVGQHRAVHPPEAAGATPVSQTVARQRPIHTVAAVGGAVALGELIEGAELDRCVYVVGLVYDLVAFKARVGAHVERVSRRPDVMRMTEQAAMELRSRGYRPAIMRGAVAESFEELVGQANDLRVFAEIATAAPRTTWPQQRSRYLAGVLGERFKKRDHGITRVLTLRERLPESIAAVKTASASHGRGATFPQVDAETPAGDALCGLCDILASVVHRALAGEAPIRAAVRGKIVHIYDHVTKQNYRLTDAFP